MVWWWMLRVPTVGSRYSREMALILLSILSMASAHLMISSPPGVIRAGAAAALEDAPSSLSSKPICLSPQAGGRAHREATETLRLWSRTAIRYFNCCRFQGRSLHSSTRPPKWRPANIRPSADPSFCHKNSASARFMTNVQRASAPDRQVMPTSMHHGGGIHRKREETGLSRRRSIRPGCTPPKFRVPWMATM